MHRSVSRKLSGRRKSSARPSTGDPSDAAPTAAASGEESRAVRSHSAELPRRVPPPFLPLTNGTAEATSPLPPAPTPSSAPKPHPPLTPTASSPSGTPTGQADHLPTYDELRSREPTRFGRWRGWIEKRAREQRSERAAERERRVKEGKPMKTSWNLDGDSGQDDDADRRPQRQLSLVTGGDERAFSAASSSTPATRSGHDSDSPEIIASPVADPARVDNNAGATRLTPATSIHPVGSRFLCQFSSQPLCAAPLPLAPSRAGKEGERFLLVGNQDGLFICDLVPSLSLAKNVQSVCGADAKIYQLWSGLSVHQLDVAIERGAYAASSGTSAAVQGIMLALTEDVTGKGTRADNPSAASSKIMRMWPLQAIINLVKWRVFDSNSTCLDLSFRTSRNSKRQSAFAVGATALHGLRQMFIGANEKGKAREGSMPFRSSPLASPPSRSQSQPPTDNGEAWEFVPDDQTHVPLTWATRNVPLDLARIRAVAPGGILFMKVCGRPTASSTDWRALVGGSEEAAVVPRSLLRRGSVVNGRRRDRGVLYLLVATKQVIFLLQSEPGEKRTWHIATEMAVPFSPGAATLVLGHFDRRPIRSASIPSTAATSGLLRSSSRSGGPPAASLSRRSASDALFHGPGGTDLAVAVAMRNHAVLIRLADLSVKEIEQPGGLRGGSGDSVGSRRSTRTNGSTKRRKSIREAAGGAFGHFARSSLGGGSAAVGGSASVDDLIRAHYRGGSLGELNPPRGSFDVESRRTYATRASGGERRWTAFDEWALPLSSAIARKGVLTLYLCTRGHLTHVIASPLGSGGSAREDAMGGGAVTLRPLHVFSWRGVPFKVSARVTDVPRAWRSLSSQPGSPRAGEAGELFCCVTAFTSTVIETQEGFISLSALGAPCPPQAHPTTGDEAPGASKVPRFFTPAAAKKKSSASGSPAARDNENEEELSDSSSYDYNTPGIGWLCTGGAPWLSSTTKAAHVRVSEDSDFSDEDEDDEGVERGRAKGWEVAGTAGGGDWFWTQQATGDYRIEWVGSAGGPV